jgi:hypothetical protein
MAHAIRLHQIGGPEQLTLEQVARRVCATPTWP